MKNDLKLQSAVYGCILVSGIKNKAGDKEMFCEKCGMKLAENAKFCQRCGAPVRPAPAGNSPGPDSPGQSLQYSYSSQPSAKKKMKKWPFILAAVLILAIACTIGGILLFRDISEKNNFANYISSAQRYLEEMDYEKAEDAYLKAIKIDPKQAEPYLKLADIYTAGNESDKAEAILKQGAEKTDNPDIIGRYSLYTYTEDFLIPTENEVKEGEYICEYTSGDSLPVLENADTEPGILTSRIRDFDGDGAEELLVLVLKYEETNAGHLILPADYACHKVYMRMYELNEGEVILQDEVPAIYPVLGAGDYEEAGIFIQESEGTIYIGGSSDNLIAGGATTTSMIDSFVMTYDGGAFTKLAGYDEPALGTTFDDESTPDKMAELLEDIGLEDAVGDMRKYSIAVLDFQADFDDLLMYVSGENDGSGDKEQYYSGFMEGVQRPELLGKVVFRLQLMQNENNR